jgi:hypothetical protein
VRVGRADHHLQHAAASRGRAAARGDGRGHRRELLCRAA